MIIVNLTGGLGNQMFQYAFGRALAQKYKTDLKLHFTNALFNIQRSYELDIFNISATIATKEDLKKFGVIQNRVLNRLLYLFDERYGIQLNKHIVTQRYPYIFNSKYLAIKNNSYIQGYWADERYFKEVENILRKEFTLKKKLDDKNLQILKQINKVNSVSIHVRRGDYISNKTNIPKFIGLNYYVKSINKIKNKVSNPIFFVFSDDILWCKQNLNSFINNVYYIDHNKGKDSYKDLLLMSACKHNIIANSTFSWWGSWLNQNLNKIIIKP
jgi:hypothetical protein